MSSNIFGYASQSTLELYRRWIWISLSSDRFDYIGPVLLCSCLISAMFTTTSSGVRCNHGGLDRLTIAHLTWPSKESNNFLNDIWHLLSRQDISAFIAGSALSTAFRLLVRMPKPNSVFVYENLSTSITYTALRRKQKQNKSFLHSAGGHLYSCLLKKSIYRESPRSSTGLRQGF